MICPQIDAQTMKPDRFLPGSHLSRWALSVVIVLRHCMQRLRSEAAAHPPDFTAPCFQFAVEGAGIVTVERREGDPSSISSAHGHLFHQLAVLVRQLRQEGVSSSRAAHTRSSAPPATD